jgi:hypothetical protein
MRLYRDFNGCDTQFFLHFLVHVWHFGDRFFSAGERLYVIIKCDQTLPFSSFMDASNRESVADSAPVP